MAGPCASSDSSRCSSSQADKRCLLARGGTRSRGRRRWRVPSGEDVVLGSILESPLGIVGRLLVVVSAEDDVRVGVGPVQRLLGAPNTPAIGAVFRGCRLADGNRGSGAGDIAVESSHVLQSVNQCVRAKK